MCYNLNYTKSIPQLIVVLLIACLSSSSMMAQGKVFINELMQSNVDFMMVNHDFPDSWVELYNGSNTTVDVKNYCIGSTDVYEDAYPLSASAVDLQPGEYLTLYCDKTTDTPFHYNFNLDAGKGKLFLFDDTGAIVDSVIYKKMPAPNVAFGRVTDGSEEWQYELTPTPGAPNNSVGSDEVLPEPLFSVEGHVMKNGPETITISMPEGVPEDTRIYLTTDGSEPTWESPSNTLFTLNIDKSTVVRAKLLSHEMLPIRSTTHSYIFHPRATTLPIVCIATDNPFLFGSEGGILTNDSTDGKPNYSYDWRRPANFEFFRTTADTTVFNQCGEMAVAGVGTRYSPQKSIKCYAKNRFGKKKFKGSFWRDKPEVTKVKSFVLRNGGNNSNSYRIIDAAIQKFFGTNLEEIDWQAYEPVIVYINGEYKGIYGFRERSNEDYVTSNYDVEEDDVEIATGKNYRNGKVQDTPHFNAFHALYHKADVTYEELCEEMNIENFMNAFIAECYAGNTDYPNNNVAIWKDIANQSKWNWILKDIDLVNINEPAWNMFNYMLGTDDIQAPEYELSQIKKSTRILYERMMSFPEFRDHFLATYATYLGDFLRPDICVPIVREMDNEILDEIDPTIAAYNDMERLKKHKVFIERFCNHLIQRPDYVYQQMADYFQLGGPIKMSVNSIGEREISICGTPLRTGVFQGKWFTHFPLSIEATDDSSTEWIMVVTHADGSESTYVYNTAEIQPSLASCSPSDSISFIAAKTGAISLTHKVIINELMQSNVDFMMVNHDFPDSWVELYNGSIKTVDVKDYRIGSTDVYEDAYPLSASAVDLQPGEYLTLYCDKTTDTPFHYNFNLDAGKGKLFLFDDTGAIVDSVIYKKMPAPNVAFGRVTDGSEEWQYELTPTPGAPNNSVGSDEVLPEPLFSVEGHVMKNGPETITISMPEGVPEDTRIYLTTDGSEPTWESPSNTLFTLNIDKSTVVRAKLLSHEMLPIRSTTHSYIFHPRATTLPIVCIATDDPFLFSSEEGIFSDESTDGIPNYKYDWRRPANFEYFRTTADTTVFNQCGEMAIGGNFSRSMPQKSIKCYAKNRFGKKNFKGSFWRDKPEVTKVKSFMLRNGGTNCLRARIEDEAIQKFFGTNIDEIDWQAYEPVIVYINGVYKGIYGFRERSNEDNVASNHDIDDDEVETANANEYVYPQTNTSFYDFYTLYHRNDVSYEEMAAAMNTENFMNVFIGECYASNTDYPHHNVNMWKQKGVENKWNWILYDLDMVFTHDASWDMFKYMLGTDNPDDEEYASSNVQKVVKARTLYEKMMSFPEFRNRFLASYATYLGDFLRSDVCKPIIKEMYDEIVDEIAPTYAAYDNMSTLDKFKNRVNRLWTYVNDRPAQVYQQMADYFALGNVIPVSILNDIDDSRSISVCGIPLRTGMFQGSWFTQFPLSIEATDDPSTGWTMVVTHADGSESTYIFDIPKIQPSLALCALGDSITFIATEAGTTGILSVLPTPLEGVGGEGTIYDVTGKKIPAIHRGVNIVLYSDGTRRKVITK